MKTFTMDLAGRTLRVDVGRVAAQANGAAFQAVRRDDSALHGDGIRETP